MTDYVRPNKQRILRKKFVRILSLHLLILPKRLNYRNSEINVCIGPGIYAVYNTSEKQSYSKYADRHSRLQLPSLPFPIIRQINNSPFLPILTETHLFHTFHLISCVSKPSDLSTSTLYAFFFRPRKCHMPHTSHPPWLDQLNNIWCGGQTTKLFNVVFSVESCNITLTQAKASPIAPHSQTPSDYAPSLM